MKSIQRPLLESLEYVEKNKLPTATFGLHELSVNKARGFMTIKGLTISCGELKTLILINGDDERILVPVVIQDSKCCIEVCDERDDEDYLIWLE